MPDEKTRSRVNRAGGGIEIYCDRSFAAGTESAASFNRWGLDLIPPFLRVDFPTNCLVDAKS